LVIILIVSIYSTNLPPLLNGTLRFLESAIGTSIGLCMVWLLRYVDRKKALLLKEQQPQDQNRKQE
ncbi:MAG: hypothetical protein ACRCS7_11680, partial [Tannerellaceae bacterium]